MRGLRREPYLVFAALAFLGLLYFAVTQPWNTDLGMHLATVVRWEHDLWNPRNPLIDMAGPSPYYTPFMLCWVLLAKAFGLTQFTVLKIAAAVNAVLLLIGVRLFVGSFTRSRVAPMLSLLAMVLIWGSLSTRWSGLYPLGTLLIMLPFPSTFGTACTLILFGLVRSAVRRTRVPWAQLALIVVLSAVIVLSHPVVAVAAGLGTVILLVEPLVRARDAGKVLLWLGAGLAGLLLAEAWPWFRLTDVLTSSGGLDELHYKLYEHALRRYRLLLLTIPALIVRARRRPYDPLVLLAGINGLLVLLDYLTGHYSLARQITWAAFAAQTAAVVELLHALRGWKPRMRILTRGLVVTTVIGALVAGAKVQVGVLGSLLSQSTVTARPKPSGADRYRSFGDYAWAARQMHYGDVVLSENFYALRMAPAYGVYTVAPAYPDPFLNHAQSTRETDTKQFFRSSTSWAQRAQIIKTYDVGWVVATRKEWEPPTERRAGIRYTHVATGHRDERLYRVHY